LSNPRWRPVTEGRPVLLPLVVLALVTVLIFPPAVFPVLLAAGAIVLAFRDPERDIRPSGDVALAPADGRVIHVGRVWDAYWQAELVEIAIFLSLADVHIQRSPLDGEVVAQHRRAGGYRPAMSRAATHGNNQLATYMRSAAGPCVVTQISGLVARRIVSWVESGMWLTQGERLGMIKFGSQVTLRLPPTALVLVDVGDHVRAGLTPVAELAQEEIPAPEFPIR
jgi:phosphatidylserine decarboxylase